MLNGSSRPVLTASTHSGGITHQKQHISEKKVILLSIE